MGGLEKLSQFKSSQVVDPSDFSKFLKLVTLFVNMNIHDPINWWVIFWPKYLELSILSCLKMAQSLVRSSSLATSMTWVPSAYCSRTHSQTHMDDYKTGSWVTSQAEVVSWQTLDFIWQPKLSKAFFFCIFLEHVPGAVYIYCHASQLGYANHLSLTLIMDTNSASCSSDSDSLLLEEEK